MGSAEINGALGENHSLSRGPAPTAIPMLAGSPRLLLLLLCVCVCVCVCVGGCFLGDGGEGGERKSGRDGFSGGDAWLLCQGLGSGVRRRPQETDG